MAAPLYRVESAVTDISAGSLELALERVGMAHFYLGVQFYTSAAGTTLATPTSGTMVLDVKTSALPDVFQRLPNSVNLAQANEQFDWNSPTRSAKVTLSNINGGGATHFKIFVAAVRS